MKKKQDTSHTRHKKNFLSAAKNEAERKEMLEKEFTILCEIFMYKKWITQKY